MSFELSTEKKGDVLWVTATGARSLQTVLAMAKDILAACVENKVKKVLTDVRALEGRLGVLDGYEIVKKHFPKMKDPSVISQIAIVDLKEFSGSFKFFEDVAVNRGFRVRIFSDIEEAIDWLQR